MLVLEGSQRELEVLRGRKMYLPSIVGARILDGVRRLA